MHVLEAGYETAWAGNKPFRLAANTAAEPALASLLLPLVHHLAVENRRLDDDVVAGGWRLRHEVGRKHDDVGEHAGSEGAFALILERRVGRPARVRLDYVSHRQLLIGRVGRTRSRGGDPYALPGRQRGHRPVAAERQPAPRLLNE